MYNLRGGDPGKAHVKTQPKLGKKRGKGGKWKHFEKKKGPGEKVQTPDEKTWN